LITIKLARLFIPRKSESVGGGGGRGRGQKIKGKNKWKRRTMSYISTLFLFWKPQQSKGNKITVVGKGGRRGLQLTEVYRECPGNVLIILGRAKFHQMVNYYFSNCGQFID
jgi:hypothetical protein